MHARVTERRAQRDANDAPADVLRRKRRAAPSFRRWVIGRKYRALHRRCREGRRRAAPSRPRRNFRAKYRASKASETLRGSVRRSPPISRVLLRRAMSRAMTVIPLGPPLPTGSSRLPADSASSVVVRLFGVAPDGGCRVSPAPKKEATRLCGPVPRLRVGREASAMCGRALPGIPLCGARTFLSPGTNPGQRRSGRLRSAIIAAALMRLSIAASCLRAAASPSLHRIRATAARWMLRVAM